MKLSSIRYHSSQYLLFDWVLIKVTGADRETFFQGQVTNDLSLLKESQGQLTARLNRVGKLQSFFFIAKFFDHLYLLCPEAIVLEIKEDFEKYIIMDDVILEIEKRPLWLQFNSFLNTPKNVEPYFDFNFYGLNARLVFRKEENSVFGRI